MIARLPQLHAQRVAAQAAAYEEEAATLRAAHEAECAMVRKLNEDIQRYGKLAATTRLHSASSREATFPTLRLHLLRLNVCLTHFYGG